MLKVGLRFRKGDACILRHFAERVERGEIQGTASTYRQAEKAAAAGEPLTVVCADEAEAQTMASAYAMACGIRRPAVEELSGA